MPVSHSSPVLFPFHIIISDLRGLGISGIKILPTLNEEVVSLTWDFRSEKILEII
jgi:hypothetical protein